MEEVSEYKNNIPSMRESDITFVFVLKITYNLLYHTEMFLQWSSIKKVLEPWRKFLMGDQEPSEDDILN